MLHLPRWTPEIRQLQAHGVIRAVHMESMCQPASPGSVNGHVYRTPQPSGTTKSLGRASRVSFVRGFHRCPSCTCTHLTPASNARRLFDMQVTWLKKMMVYIYTISIYVYTCSTFNDAIIFMSLLLSFIWKQDWAGIIMLLLKGQTLISTANMQHLHPKERH